MIGGSVRKNFCYQNGSQVQDPDARRIPDPPADSVRLNGELSGTSPRCVSRLAYLHSLREAGSGRYVHQGLEMLYGAAAVDKVIAQCHEEVFERLLEMPLNAQRDDLRTYLASLPGTSERNAMASLNNGSDMGSSAGTQLPQRALQFQSERASGAVAGRYVHGSPR